MITYDNWRNHALCREHDPNMFYYDEPPWDSDQYQSRSWRRAQKKKLLEAEQICFDCPVFVQCEVRATEDDKDWTMRAGLLPRMLTRRSNEVSPERAKRKAEAQRQRRALEREDPEKYAQVRKGANASRDMKMATETPQERALRLARDRETARIRRANRTNEQVIADRQKNTEYARARRNASRSGVIG